MIDYAKLKEGLRDAGYDVSAGTTWTATDHLHYKAYVYLNQTNLSLERASRGLAYTGLLPVGFPGTESDVLVSISLLGLETPIVEGEEREIQAVGHWAGGATTEIEVTLTSSDPLIASVDQMIVTGVSAGPATISATSGAIEGEVNIVVIKQVESLSIGPYTYDYARPLGSKELIKVTAVFDDQTTDDVTDLVTWTVSDPQIIHVDQGLLYADALGVSDVTATLAGVSVTQTIPVKRIVDLTQTGLGSWGPFRTSVPVAIDMTVRGTFEDDTPSTVDHWIEITSDNPDITISREDYGEDIYWHIPETTPYGQVSFTVSLDDVTKVFVNQWSDTDKLSSNGLPAKCVVGATHQMQAKTYPAETDVTASPDIVWTSSDPETVSVSPTGLLTFIKPGPFEINVVYHYMTFYTPVTGTVVAE